MSSKSEIFNARSSKTNLITQEMVEVALQAIVKNCGFTHNMSKDAASAAFTAVYPLILEQAAKVCDKWIGVGDTYSSKLTAMQLAEAIRNLKDKTDVSNS